MLMGTAAVFPFPLGSRPAPVRLAPKPLSLSILSLSIRQGHLQTLPRIVPVVTSGVSKIIRSLNGQGG